MKWNINIYQAAVIENGWNLDIVDMAILEVIKSFILSGNCHIQQVEEEQFYWVSHVKILSELPIVKITSPQGLKKHIDKLITEGLLTRSESCRKMGKTLYGLGPKMELLEFNEPRNKSYEPSQQKLRVPRNKSYEYNNTIDTITKSLFEEAGPTAQPEGIHTFENSKIGTYEAWEKMFEAEALAGIDLVYYYNAVKDWARGKTGTAPKKKADWPLTVRNWLRRDRQAGKLVTTTHEKIVW